MTIKKILILSVFISILFTCKESVTIEFFEDQIIPKPQKTTINKGHFILDTSVNIKYEKDFKVSANFLKIFIESASTISFGSDSKKSIQFIKDNSIGNSEAYRLIINPSEIVIKAATDQGAFYAVQTLRQLLPTEFENGTYMKDEVPIKCLTIEDEPKFKYRGMHLDVGRHMFSVEFIKKYIDALAMLKLNTFHWHLTEDQGWRIEIKKYPKLQEIAAFRKETLIGHYSDQPHKFDAENYGGFYTQKEIKDIVAYAESKHVTIIPEIELPGHSQAAIAAYPELGCTGQQVEVATKWGVFEDIYCPKEETFKFLENVLDEVIALFPGKYIHIGGDEAPKTRWKNCEHCQALIKKEGLKDEHELQSYFISKIEKYLNSKGRQIIGWDEILEGGLAPNATVMSWRGINGAVEAAKQGHDVIMTPTSHCYFDYYQSENENEPLAIGGYLPLEKVYSFNPIPEELNPEQSKHVLGVQGNIWTEYIPNSKQVEYMMYPRVLAMSEINWSNPENKDYNEFVSRVEHFHKRLDALNVNYANHLYEIEGEVIINNGETKYKLSTPIKGKVIRLELNGNEPNSESSAYQAPILIDTSLTIKAAVYNFGEKEKLGSTFTQRINYHKAVGKKITINKQLNKSYPGSGAQGLINGISGSNNRYGDKEWLGFWGEDLEIMIDLGVSMQINSIKTRFHNGKGQWIYAPKQIEVRFDNNDSYSIFKTTETTSTIVPLDINTNAFSRYIFLKVPNYGIIPEGKQGSGNPAWTFIDEIIVN